jgi:hypothetical protein
MPREKSSGLLMSISSLPFRFASPASASASSAPLPFVALKTTSPKAAASAKLPASLLAPPACHSPSLAGSRAEV